jgi:uncharacterized membrane protein YecN with MAPEG domain
VLLPASDSGVAQLREREGQFIGAHDHAAHRLTMAFPGLFCKLALRNRVTACLRYRQPPLLTFLPRRLIHMNQVALACVAVLGLLLFGLGLSISVVRFRQGTVSGCDPDPANPLHKLIRAHANTAEYAPFLALLFLYLGARSPSTATVSLIVAATVCRCLLVIGLIAWPTMAQPNPFRFVGALGTYLAGLALCAMLLH